MSGLHIPINTDKHVCKDGNDIYHALEPLEKTDVFKAIKKILEDFYENDAKSESLSIADIRGIYKGKRKNKMHLVGDLITYFQEEKIVIQASGMEDDIHEIIPGEVSSSQEIPENIIQVEKAITLFIQEIQKEVRNNTKDAPSNENENQVSKTRNAISNKIRNVNFQYILDNFYHLYSGDDSESAPFKNYSIGTQIDIFFRNMGIPKNRADTNVLKTQLREYYKNPTQQISEDWVDIITRRIFNHQGFGYTKKWLTEQGIE